jgi:predicted nuclease of restriction endonuclease-like (RecB) superfamily
MNPDQPRTRTSRASTNDHAFDFLLEQIRSLVQSARKTAATAINSVQVITSFEIGRMIIEHEQQGVQRAKYGQRVLKTLSDRLTAEFGRGFSRSNLQNMRLFFLAYHDRLPPKRQMPSGKLPGEKSQTASGASTLAASTARPDQQSPFQLSWSQYVLLLSITDPNERNFYEIESVTNGWTLPELRRQFNSSLYEGLALSRNKNEVRRLAQVGQIVSNPKDLMKEPYVLEFLGIDEKATYSESDLETAIIDKLGHFLLELGKGFLFEARQKRFTFDDDHFFVDLVFYNRLLRCYVLIDLKIGRLTHQDLGQMQMYVNYFDRYVKTPDERPTVGMILCKQKRTALVELTLPKDANIHASQYQLYLPSKEDLKQRLMEWAGEEDTQ